MNSCFASRSSALIDDGAGYVFDMMLKLGGAEGYNANNTVVKKGVISSRCSRSCKEERGWRVLYLVISFNEYVDQLSFEFMY